ncbi:MAG: ROK family protein [Bacilli bacterium]
MNPPNLPGWDGIKIAEIFEDKYKTACGLQNDANACALAEWKFGAYERPENMVFMTFEQDWARGLFSTANCTLRQTTTPRNRAYKAFRIRAREDTGNRSLRVCSGGESRKSQK